MPGEEAPNPGKDGLTDLDEAASGTNPKSDGWQDFTTTKPTARAGSSFPSPQYRTPNKKPGGSAPPGFRSVVRATVT